MNTPTQSRIEKLEAAQVQAMKLCALLLDANTDAEPLLSMQLVPLLSQAHGIRATLAQLQGALK